MGPGSILQWFLFANMLMACAPGVLWMKRGARENTRIGMSMGLAIVILVGTVNTFQPWSMWVLAMPHAFNTPWYYITGVVFTAIAGFNLYNLAKLPPKPRLNGQKRPIW
jgi:Na+/proline symporter